MSFITLADLYNDTVFCHFPEIMKTHSVEYELRSYENNTNRASKGLYFISGLDSKQIHDENIDIKYLLKRQRHDILCKRFDVYVFDLNRTDKILAYSKILGYCCLVEFLEKLYKELKPQAPNIVLPIRIEDKTLDELLCIYDHFRENPKDASACKRAIISILLDVDKRFNPNNKNYQYLPPRALDITQESYKNNKHKKYPNEVSLQELALTGYDFKSINISFDDVTAFKNALKNHPDILYSCISTAAGQEKPGIMPPKCRFIYPKEYHHEINSIWTKAIFPFAYEISDEEIRAKGPCTFFDFPCNCAYEMLRTLYEEKIPFTICSKYTPYEIAKEDFIPVMVVNTDGPRVKKAIRNWIREISSSHYCKLEPDIKNADIISRCYNPASDAQTIRGFEKIASEIIGQNCTYIP